MPTGPSRRHFLKAGVVAAGALGLGATAPLALFRSTVLADTGDPSAAAAGGGGADASVWRQARRILARVKPPTFPNRTFDITKYGAVTGGTTKCTDAIREAIKDCNAAGGGMSSYPPAPFSPGRSTC